jgi:hypothetical protein
MAKAAGTTLIEPPRLERTAGGDIQTNSLAEVIQWFLDYDQRVALMRHPNVDALFQWKQIESQQSGHDVAPFDHAEDRFAIGIFQALAENRDAVALHTWVSDLVQALNDAMQTKNEMAEAFKLDPQEASAMRASEALPTERERRVYLTCSWLEALCAAEARVLGWVYQELYGQSFNPQNPPPVNS